MVQDHSEASQQQDHHRLDDDIGAQEHRNDGEAARRCRRRGAAGDRPRQRGHGPRSCAAGSGRRGDGPVCAPCAMAAGFTAETKPRTVRIRKAAARRLESWRKPFGANALMQCAQWPSRSGRNLTNNVKFLSATRKGAKSPQRLGNRRGLPVKVMMQASTRPSTNRMSPAVNLLDRRHARAGQADQRGATVNADRPAARGGRYSTWIDRMAQAVGSSLVELRHLGNARQAEEFGAAALHVAQIIGVIDHARKVGVLVIDAERQDMDLAVEDVPGPSATCLHSSPSSANRPIWDRDRAAARRAPDGHRPPPSAAGRAGCAARSPAASDKGSTISSMASRASPSAAAMVSIPTGPPPKFSAISAEIAAVEAVQARAGPLPAASARHRRSWHRPWPASPRRRSRAPA